MIKKTILVSGGRGRFAAELQKQAVKLHHHMICLGLSEMDVRDRMAIDCAIVKYKPDVFIHCAAVLKDSPVAGLETNVLGTTNVVLACIKHKVKLVYISTDYVYPGGRVNHSESDPLLPFTAYGWTKLGGECAVRTYANSLIIRGAICPRPYPHKKAYTDIFKNLIYQDKAAGYVLRLLDEKGVINLGESKVRSLYDFARETRNDVRRAISPPGYTPKRSRLSVDKLKNVLKEKCK